MSTHKPLGFIRPSSKRAAPDRRIRVLGIDLGTTNSTVSEIVWDPSEPKVPAARTLEVAQPTLEGTYTHTLVPSVVALYNGRVFVGEGAKRLRSRASELGLERGRDIFYECKNDIGIRRTYHKAPEGFTSAAEIGGHVVKFMIDAALADDPTPIDRVVVTVPASFQVAQRTDTVNAMRLAGLEVAGGDLIDEPVAAFLDYLTAHRDDGLEITRPSDLLVFDFGGGTCDVAVLRVSAQPEGGGIEVGTRAVSRYHRLGGGDIDRAIVFEELIPRLLEENGLGTFGLDFAAKKQVLEPALLDLAEGLKEGLCREISRLQSFDKYEQERDGLVRRLPETRSVTVDGRELKLTKPELGAARFEELLESFLDPDLLFPTETEYVLTQSVFAPLTDALDRGGLAAEDVGLALLVGGSSLVPQIAQAVEEFLPDATVLSYGSRDDVKACVSRGAAYQAMSLALFGEGQVQPVCAEPITIRTLKGPVELVAAGTPLPYPADGGFAANHDLRVPKTCGERTLDLRVELLSGADERRLGSQVAFLAPPVTRGDELELRYRFDENQTLQLTVTHRGEEGPQTAGMEFENPLTNVVNPQTVRLRIDETEEELRTNPNLTREQRLAKLERIGSDYAELGQREKALAHLMSVMRAKGTADAGLLNKMGIICGEMGDHEKEEKYYLECAKAAPRWGGALFNLSLAVERRGDTEKAAVLVDKALERERDPAYLVQRADLADRMNDTQLRNSLLAEAIAAFGSPRSLEDFELGWLIKALRMHGDAEALQAAEAERRSRRQSDGAPGAEVGELPDADTRRSKVLEG